MLMDVNSDGIMESIAALAIKPPWASSTLNPYAPSFFPTAFTETEDFSQKWWNLVQTSPTFRDYWLLERLPYVEDEQLTPEDVDELEGIVDFIDEESLSSNDDLEESIELLQAGAGISQEEKEEHELVLQNAVDGF